MHSRNNSLTVANNSRVPEQTLSLSKFKNKRQSVPAQPIKVLSQSPSLQELAAKVMNLH